MRATLDGLADTWKRFRQYAYAFKHGGLVPHQPDFQLVDDDGNMLDSAIAVWIRKKDQPRARGHTKQEIDLATVVRELELRAEMAIDVLDAIVSVRLSLADHAATNDPGPPDGTTRIAVPVRFKLGEHGLSDNAIRELEALGLTFSIEGRESI